MTQSKQRQRKAAVSTSAVKIQSTGKKSVVRISDAHELFDGRIRIYRTVKSGDVWQFRMYVQSEQRYVRESLRTRETKKSQFKGRNQSLLNTRQKYCVMKKSFQFQQNS